MAVKGIPGTALTTTTPAKGGKVSFVQQVIKGDTYLVLSSTAFEPEDEFVGLYFTQTDSSKVVLKPPFEPKRLVKLTEQNNILYQCIEAMEVNIDGTGHEFESVKEGVEADKKEIELAQEFFSEPYPGESFISQRRALRRDLESIGYGFLEVLRTMDGKLFGTRRLAAQSLRLVRLDDPVPVKKKIMRGGAEIECTVNERERRFAMVTSFGAGSAQYQYYRQYGASRQLNRETGEWEKPGKPVPVEKRATELLFFGMNSDVDSPYYLPRWLNQLPSVIGSRKAEEQNLEYFDAGGMPPAIIFIQGGTLAKGMADQLRMYLSGQNKSRNRAAVVEALSSSGSLESSGGVQVKVERFGAEKANDSMYSKYDLAAEEHVRTAFRLPLIFLGKSQDYNYATAKTAYMVAEAQVFAPERTEFDHLINRTLMKELGFKTIKFRSLPINLKDSDLAMKAIELVKDSVEGEGLVTEVNQLAGLTLEYKEPEDPLEQVRGQNAVAAENLPNKIKETEEMTRIQTEAQLRLEEAKRKKDEAKKLAQEYVVAEGLVEGPEFSEAQKVSITKAVDELKGLDRAMFLESVSEIVFGEGDKLVVCEH